MLRSVTANNPSPLTGPGTTTYLVGTGHVALIDPGPYLPAHRDAILALLNPGEKISHILVTHAHLDHSGGARPLSAQTHAPVFAFGDAQAGRSASMTRLAEAGLHGGGEGIDSGFTPDEILQDGQLLRGRDWALRAIHTPGHFGNHLAFDWDGRVFCGDVVMGWSSTLISPPDGDLIDYFRSLDRLAVLTPRQLLPTHGAPVDAPAARLSELAAHRRERSAQIVATLREGPASAPDLARRLYDAPPVLLPAATRNVFAHLLALTTLGAVDCEGDLAAESFFRLA